MTKTKPKKMPKIGRKSVRSQFEYDVYKDLLNKIPSKKHNIGYEVDLLEYTIVKNYMPDFTIETPDGIIYVEAKGLGRAFDQQAREKMEAVKRCHPDKDIRIVFMTDRPFRKGGKMRPSDWALKHGFPCSIKEVPEEWFKKDSE